MKKLWLYVTPLLAFIVTLLIQRSPIAHRTFDLALDAMFSVPMLVAIITYLIVKRRLYRKKRISND